MHSKTSKILRHNVEIINLENVLSSVLVKALDAEKIVKKIAILGLLAEILIRLNRHTK
jgi:hypothetical protein